MTQRTGRAWMIPLAVWAALAAGSCSTFHDVGDSQRPEPLPMQTLSVLRSGPGAGRLTSHPSALDCGEVCGASFPVGSAVTLTAGAQPGSVFNGWTGCPVGNDATCNIRLTEPLTVGALFDVMPANPSVLTVETQGPGRLTAKTPAIDCAGRCKQTYELGTRVVLIPRPDPNSYFAGWSGACTGTIPTCVVVLNEARSVRALFSPAHCAYPNFCWSNPIPTGSPLRAIWGTAEDDIWIGGDAGGLMHFDGVGWTVASLSPASTMETRLLGAKELELPPAPRVSALWGSRAANYLAAVDGGLFHFDGREWTRVATPAAVTVSRLHGSSENNVWAIGDAVAGEGGVLHFDGTRWSQVALGTTPKLTDVYTTGPNDVWLATTRDLLWHFDGVDWKAYTSPVSAQSFTAITGSGPRDIYAAGSNGVLHWDGTSWSVDRTAPRLTRIASAATNDVWGTTGPLLYHFNGSTWQFVATSNPQENLFAYGRSVWVLGRGAGELWRVEGNNLVPFYNNVAIPDIGYADSNLRRIWIGSSTDAWAVGDQGTIAHFDGVLWTKQPSVTIERLNAIDGLSGKDLWVGGSNGLLLHYDGTSWTKTPTPPSIATQTILSIWTSFGGPLWYLTDKGVVVHGIGAGGSPQQLGDGNNVYSGCIWGTDPKHLFLATAGQIFRWEPLTFRWQSALANTYTASCGAGSSATDAWVGGPGWARYDGVKWEVVTDRGYVTGPLLDMTALAPNNYWATQQYKFSLSHFDGARWEERQTPGLNLFGLKSRGADLWAVGFGGAILHYRP